LLLIPHICSKNYKQGHMINEESVRNQLFYDYDNLFSSAQSQLPFGQYVLFDLSQEKRKAAITEII